MFANFKTIQISIVLILNLFHCKIYAYIDSLDQSMIDLPVEKRIEKALEIAENQISLNNNRAKILTDSASRWSENLESGFYKGKINILYGDIYFVGGQYDLSMSYYKQAFDIASEQKDQKLLSKALMGIGINLDHEGRYVEALEIMFQSLDLRKGTEDLQAMSSAYNNISKVYYLLDRYDLAIEYIKKSLEIDMQRNDIEGLGYSYSNLGSYYYTVDSISQALECHNKALNFRKKIGDLSAMAKTYNNLASVYEELGRFDSCKKYYEKAILLKTEHSSAHDLAISFSHYGSTLLKFGYLDQALNNLLEARNMFDQQMISREYIRNFQYLSMVYEKLDSPLVALEYHKLYHSKMDSFANTSNASMVPLYTPEIEKVGEDHSEDFIYYYSFVITILCLFMVFMYFRRKQKH